MRTLIGVVILFIAAVILILAGIVSIPVLEKCESTSIDTQMCHFDFSGKGKIRWLKIHI